MTILADLSWPNLALGLGVGLSCQAAQKLLEAGLSRTNGWWSKQPTFVAHQIVAFPLMLYVASVGCAAWFSPRPADHGFPDERIFGHDATGSHLAIVLLGALLIWDIPLTLDPSIYSAASMGHHVGLAALALLSLRPFVQYYAPFFVGVTELSSVPLQIVDFFHPNHFAELTVGRPVLETLNAFARVSFTVLFLVIRTVWFPIVVFGLVFPDLFKIIASGEPTGATFSLLGAAAALAFTGLQWHWSYLLLKQIAKMLRGGKKGDGGGAGKPSEMATDATPLTTAYTEF